MKVLALIVGVLVLASPVWTASELHYGNCIAAAQARGPLVPLEPGFAPDQRDAYAKETQTAARQVAAVNDCSRLP